MFYENFVFIPRMGLIMRTKPSMHTVPLYKIRTLVRLNFFVYAKLNETFGRSLDNYLGWDYIFMNGVVSGNLLVAHMIVNK